MEQGHFFNTIYFINKIIRELATNLKSMGKFPDKKWCRLHLDDDGLHNSQDSVDHLDEQKFARLPIFPAHRI
jgi:hypothetical protein